MSKDISLEIKGLIDKYGSNVRQAIQENSKLEYLYALSDMRENVLEWYPFEKDAALLQVGSDYGALTGLFARRVSQVVVLDESEENLKVNAMRYPGEDHIRYELGNIQGISGQGSYDYVVMAGSLRPPFEDQIAAAKALLKPDGKLILAVCNQFGMKYWAGAPRDEYSFSKRQVEALLGEGALQFYYPIPDYKLASTVYSEDYLPHKGELTHTITAYDYPKYLLLDVGAAYDAVCEDGQFENFANSFLVIWSSHGTD